MVRSTLSENVSSCYKFGMILERKATMLGGKSLGLSCSHQGLFYNPRLEELDGSVLDDRIEVSEVRVTRNHPYLSMDCPL